MGLAFTNLKYGLAGARNEIMGTIAFDSSYPTGGEPLAAADIGLGRIERLQVYPKNGVNFEYDYTNEKLLAHRSASHTHVLHFQTAAAANAVTAAANALRTGAAAFDVAGVADSAGEGGIVNVAQLALAEVGNTVDLSALTGVRFVAVGF